MSVPVLARCGCDDDVGDVIETVAVERVASVIGVAEGGLAAYVEAHRAVWPEVLDALRASHITNYSIYVYEALLFSYFEYRGDDLAKDMEKMAADAATQNWWSVVSPLQRTLRPGPDDPWWTPLKEAFHLE